MVTKELREQLGPLAGLIGVWEGEKGEDIAPSDERGTELNKYREQLTFEQVGPVQNHEQNLHVLRYTMRAWRLGDADSFHEELGYWSWEPSTKQVMRSFLIPRGISVIAGGKAEALDREVRVEATSGSCTFGVCTNPFLDREFKILSFAMTLKFLDEHKISYDQVTMLRIPGRNEPFEHRDQNTLDRRRT
jgi:hypothetical protein